MRRRRASTVAWRCIGSARPCYASSGIRRWMCCSRSKASRPRSSTRSRRRASPGTAFFPSRCRISWPSSKPVRVGPPSSRDERVREDPHAAARSRARAVARPGTRAAPPGGAVGTARRHSRSALDALDAVATRVREASVLDKAAHAEWQEALRTAARRLEAAWLALETQVADEHRRWADEIDAVARWRPSLWPLVTLWTPLGVALVWLGLVLGGYLPAPAWLAARLGF